MKFLPRFLLEQTEANTSIRNQYHITKMRHRTHPSKISNYLPFNATTASIRDAEGEEKVRSKRQNSKRPTVLKGAETPVITGFKVALIREYPDAQSNLWCQVFNGFHLLEITYFPFSHKILTKRCKDIP